MTKTRKWLVPMEGNAKPMFSDDPSIYDVCTPLLKIGDVALVRLASGSLVRMMWDKTPKEATVRKYEVGDALEYAADIEPVEKEELISASLEAHKLIHGDRAKQYGSVHSNFQRWSDLCETVGIEISPYGIAILMALGKLARQVNKKKRDNIVDAIGYLDLAQQLLDADE